MRKFLLSNFKIIGLRRLSDDTPNTLVMNWHKLLYWLVTESPPRCYPGSPSHKFIFLSSARIYSNDQRDRSLPELLSSPFHIFAPWRQWTIIAFNNREESSPPPPASSRLPSSDPPCKWGWNLFLWSCSLSECNYVESTTDAWMRIVISGTACDQPAHWINHGGAVFPTTCHKISVGGCSCPRGAGTRTDILFTQNDGSG